MLGIVWGRMLANGGSGVDLYPASTPELRVSTKSPPLSHAVDFPESLFFVGTERPFISDDRPGFFLCEHASLHQGGHTGAGTSVLDDPE